MPESKRSRRLKRRWDAAVQAFKSTRIYCGEHEGSHVCQVTDAAHTGPHLCCCGYEWPT